MAEKEQSYDVDGVKLKASDIINITKLPQQNEDTVNTTKGSFGSSALPQELLDAYHESLEE